MMLANGTSITTGPGWAETTLPNGATVHAAPNDQSPRMAADLGYGGDVALMTQEHDPLHSRLCDALGLPYSYSLMEAAGTPVDAKAAGHEETMVLAAQRLLNRHRSLS